MALFGVFCATNNAHAMFGFPEEATVQINFHDFSANSWYASAHPLGDPYHEVGDCICEGWWEYARCTCSELPEDEPVVIRVHITGQSDITGDVGDAYIAFCPSNSGTVLQYEYAGGEFDDGFECGGSSGGGSGNNPGGGSTETLDSGQIYVMADCTKYMGTNTNLCILNTSSNCGYDLSVACANTINDGDYSYYGSKLNVNGNEYLVCFKVTDSEACIALRDGCASGYPLPGHSLIIAGNLEILMPGKIYQTENMEQLKCCRTWSPPTMEYVANGVRCEIQNSCATDGSPEPVDGRCECADGYYSTAGYTYAPGADAYDLMNGYCKHCDTTIPSNGANSVSVPPTSNGGGLITSCYLRTGTQGLDDKGAYTITGSNCKYSK